MIEEEFPDELENDLDDIEPVLSMLRATVFRRLPKMDSSWLTVSR